MIDTKVGFMCKNRKRLIMMHKWDKFVTMHWDKFVTIRAVFSGGSRLEILVWLRKNTFINFVIENETWRDVGGGWGDAPPM
jgi:hypothetical protein